MLTHQEIFDKVVTHARSMKTRCRDEVTSHCFYRDPETGNRCFIGALILDEYYDSACENAVPQIEPFGHNCVVLRDSLIRSGVDARNPKTIQLLIRLQRIHDCSEMEEWESRFAELAHDVKLRYTPPQEK